jgi:hypothetical protein
MMSNKIDELTEKFEKSSGASDSEISQIRLLTRQALPQDYIDFLKKSNGAEGFVKKSYVRIFPVSEIGPANDALEVNEFAPGLIIFASDGADTAYAFDARKDPICIVKVPFIGMSLDEVHFCGNSLTEFLEQLSRNS